MGTPSMPRVIDYLVTTFRALPLTQVPTLPWSVFDGFPGQMIPDNFIAIGGGSTPTAYGPENWALIGALKRDENYLVEIALASYVGGSSDSQNQTDYSNAQQTARNQAFAMFNAIDGALRGTPQKVTLAGNVNIASELTDINVEQSDLNDPLVKLGRRCTIVFYLHVLNRI